MHIWPGWPYRTDLILSETIPTVTITAFVQEAVQYQLHFTSNMHTRANPTKVLLQVSLACAPSYKFMQPALERSINPTVLHLTLCRP